MTQPHYQDEHVTLFHGDCLDVLRELPDASVDAVVTDPPYGLEFMGKEWDSFRAELGIDRSARWSGERSGAAGASLTPTTGVEAVRNLPTYGGQRPTTSRCLTCGKRDAFRNDHACGDAAEWVREQVQPNTAPPALLAFGEWCRQWSLEVYRVLKPGGHMLAFGGSRTWHRLACAVEDAGFEIRDSIAWLYGSGFPKSLDVAKAIDKAAGAEREVVGAKTVSRDFETGKGEDTAFRSGRPGKTIVDVTIPATPEAARWQGWGTALKPAFEPIVVARKPLAGTVAANVLAHGTGALNIDACRVAMTDADAAAINAKHAGMDPDAYERRPGDSLHLSTDPMPLVRAHAHDAGRWPTNVVLDDTQAAELDRQAPAAGGGFGVRGGGGEVYGGGKGYAGTLGVTGQAVGYGDSGGASRFFPTFRYEPKAPTSERPRVGGGKGSIANQRCRACGKSRISGNRCECPEPAWEAQGESGIAHPTVKPLNLMRWLVRLVTPPGGVVLDPFAGSGTTAEACVIEGFRCVTVEREADYLPLIVQRLTKPIPMVLDLDGGVA